MLHGVPARQFSATTAFGGPAHGSAFDADAGASATHSAMNVAIATRGRIARMGQATVDEGHYSRGREMNVLTGTASTTGDRMPARLVYALLTLTLCAIAAVAGVFLASRDDASGSGVEVGASS